MLALWHPPTIALFAALMTGALVRCRCIEHVGALGETTLCGADPPRDQDDRIPITSDEDSRRAVSHLCEREEVVGGRYPVASEGGGQYRRAQREAARVDAGTGGADQAHS